MPKGLFPLWGAAVVNECCANCGTRFPGALEGG